jgi:hypothetical protein
MMRPSGLLPSMVTFLFIGYLSLPSLPSYLPRCLGFGLGLVSMARGTNPLQVVKIISRAADDMVNLGRDGRAYAGVMQPAYGIPLEDLPPHCLPFARHPPTPLPLSPPSASRMTEASRTTGSGRVWASRICASPINPLRHNQSKLP